MTLGLCQIFTRARYPKLKMYELKIYRGVMCQKNEEWCKIWRGLDLSTENWHEEFDNFWPEHLKISKICTLMSCFWPKYIMLELKKVQRSYVWYQLAKRRCRDVVRTSLCTSQRRGSYISNETPNDISMERRQDVSVVRLHNILLERRENVSRGRNNDVSSVRLHDVSNKF